MTIRGWKLDQFLKDRRVLSSLEEIDDAPGLPRRVGTSTGASYVSSDSAETQKKARGLGVGPVPAALLSSAPWHFGMRAFRQHSR